MRDAKLEALTRARPHQRAEPVAPARWCAAFAPSGSRRWRSWSPPGSRLPAMLRAIRAGAGDNVKGRGRCTDTQAHIVLGHQRVLERGFSGLRDDARARREKACTADERAFLDAVELTCEAMRAFSQRFADAGPRPGAGRARRASAATELLQAIAERCARVPWLPPRSFVEAVQSIWFTQNAAIITYGAGSGITPGRARPAALALLRGRPAQRARSPRRTRCGCSKSCSSSSTTTSSSGPTSAACSLNHLGSDVENVTLGGVDAQGDDATNALSYLFVDAIENTNLATTASFRVSARRAPRRGCERVAAMHQKTNSPAFLCDETAIAAMVRDGYSLEDARAVLPGGLRRAQRQRRHRRRDRRHQGLLPHRARPRVQPRPHQLLRQPGRPRHRRPARLRSASRTSSRRTTGSCR